MRPDFRLKSPTQHPNNQAIGKRRPELLNEIEYEASLIPLGSMD